MNLTIYIELVVKTTQTESQIYRKRKEHRNIKPYLEDAISRMWEILQDRGSSFLSKLQGKKMRWRGNL